MAKQVPGTHGKPTGPPTPTGRRPAAQGRSQAADSKPASPKEPRADAADEMPHPLQILFGENLRTARVMAGLSQTELAARCGLMQQYLSKVEGGHKNVTLRTIATLAKAVGKEPSALLRDPKRR